MPIIEACPVDASSTHPVESPIPVLYVVVRSDLPRGVQVAHAAHAASEASGVPPSIVVALAVDGEEELRRVAEALGARSLTHALITEDAGPFAGQAMAVGVEPTLDREAIRKVVSSLPLVR